MYTDTLLIRQLQDEESNSLEQGVDALIKKRELINNRRKSLSNNHCMLNPHKHGQYVWIDPSSYDHDTIKRQKHRRCYQTAPHEYCNVEQIPLYHSRNGYPPPGYNNSSVSGDSEESSVYTCFVCGMDGHLSRFCSQMQSLADIAPNNNMLYPHGLPPVVNSVKVQRWMGIWYKMDGWYIVLCLFPDNSDSPSIVEQ